MRAYTASALLFQYHPGPISLFETLLLHHGKAYSVLRVGGRGGGGRPPPPFPLQHNRDLVSDQALHLGRGLGMEGSGALDSITSPFTWPRVVVASIGLNDAVVVPALPLALRVAASVAAVQRVTETRPCPLCSTTW